jgi:hypothetical protein
MSLSGQSVSVNTSTLTPSLVISKKLTFADPYIGGGFQSTSGNVQTTLNLPIIGSESFNQSGSAIGMYLFCGIQMTMPGAGLQLTLEGSYSPYGLNSLGLKTGIAF